MSMTKKILEEIDLSVMRIHEEEQITPDELSDLAQQIFPIPVSKMQSHKNKSEVEELKMKIRDLALVARENGYIQFAGGLKCAVEVIDVRLG